MKRRKAKKIKLYIWSEYESTNCGDGGKYGYWLEFRRLHNGRFAIYYFTTSYLPFCNICGEWNHYSEDCRYKRKTVSLKQFKKIVKQFETDFVSNNILHCWIEQEKLHKPYKRRNCND